MSIKHNWQTKKLSEILKLEYGKPLDRSLRKPDGKYPVYGANGVKDRSDKYYFDKPSIIIGRKGSAGELTIVDQPFWPLDVTYYVTFNNKEYDLLFLYNLLFTLRLPKLARGVKPGINRNDVYNIKVQIPDIKEQKRIILILSALYTEIKKIGGIYTKKLLLLEELKKSILSKAFKGEL